MSEAGPPVLLASTKLLGGSIIKIADGGMEHGKKAL
jgi:hypothetical protein